MEDNHLIRKVKLREWIDALKGLDETITLDLDPLFVEGESTKERKEQLVHEIGHTANLFGYEITEITETKVEMKRCSI